MIRTLDIARDERAPLEARKVIDEMANSLTPDLVEDARLLISELVSNSVRHGAGENIRVTMDAQPPNRLRCEVIDDGHGFLPLARPVGGREAGGWGLYLVESLSERWGVREGSTHVWFELTR